MIDLPVASTEPNCTRAAAARQSANSPRHADGTQADESAFQAVLALELGLASTGQTPDAAASTAPAKAGSVLESAGDATGTVASSVAATGLAQAGAMLESVADAARTAASGDSDVTPADADAVAFSLAIAGAVGTASAANAGDDTARTAAAGDAPVPPALAAAMAYPPALAAVALAPPASGVVSQLPAGSGSSSANAAPMTAAPGPRQNRLLRESAARDVEMQARTVPGAADIAAPGKLAPSAEGEIYRDVAFPANALDQHQAAATPAPSPAAVAATATHSGSAAPAPVAPVPVAVLEARVGDRGWDQGLGGKLVWMAGQKHQVAELHLNPPDLGPLKITLTLNDDQASAQFISAHAAVREAIETAMPRLREMLADSGITLGNASVSTDAFREQAQPQQRPRAYPAPAATEPGVLARGELALRRARGLVDTFA